MNNINIFTKPFNGSVDDLLKLTGDNADFVDDVISGKQDFVLSDVDAIDMIKSELEIADDETAKEILQNIKNDQLNDILQNLINNGLMEVKEYQDGEPLYGLTDAGREYVKNVIGPDYDQQGI